MVSRSLEEAEGIGDIVPVVFGRVSNGLADPDIGRKMENGLKVMTIEIGRKARLGQRDRR